MTGARLTPTPLLLLLAASAGAQEPEWNGPRVLELVARAREARHAAAIDTAFLSYRSEARGYVYFLFDRPDNGERTLIRADQVALELYWRAPDRTGQRIVGLRDEEVLPTNIRYHLDHLTVVQDDFGDRIRMGDGQEVEAVLHPVGPGAEALYDFRLTDSLTIRLGEAEDEVRVYEVTVRPKDPDRPGIVGTVFLDRGTASIVRMSFTFTPASYVDPYLDYIRISLDNSLWLGRYWLPRRQEVELRREMPILDMMAGSLIRGRYEIGDYRFNVEVPAALLYGGRVSASPEAARRVFPFERGLFDDLETEGLAPAPSLEKIRNEAAQVVGRRYTSGLPRLRLHVGSASEVVRYDRAEGLFLGGGLHLRPRGLSLRVSGGYALGRERPSLAVAAGLQPDQRRPTLRGYWDELRDIGQDPGASGLINSFAGTLVSRDYLDPYFASGASAVLVGTEPGSHTELALRVERHRSATDVVSAPPGSDFRPVRGVQEGDLAAVDAGTSVALPAGGLLEARGSLARLDATTYGAAVLEAEWEREAVGAGLGASLRLSAGALTSDAPPQALFLLGGRGTLPGQPYRSFVGERFWLSRAVGTHPLLPPWVGVRATAAAGGTYLGACTFPPGWGTPGDSGGPRASLGAGLSLLWEVLYFDLAHGVGAGSSWELVVSASARFGPWL